MRFHLRRGLAAAVVVLLPLAACTDESGSGTSSADPASPSTSETGDTTESPAPTDPTSAPTDDLSTLPLTTDAPPPTTSPMWAFPALVKGWTFETRDQKGVNQLTHEGSDALFTSYQLKEQGPNGTDAADSKAWLEKFRRDLSANSQLQKISTPTYGTAIIQSDHGTIEFVQQDLTYRTTAGVTYRSRFVARSLDTYLIAVQYGAPEASGARRSGSG